MHRWNVQPLVDVCMYGTDIHEKKNEKNDSNIGIVSTDINKERRKKTEQKLEQ